MDESFKREIIEWIHLSHGSLQIYLGSDGEGFLPWHWLDLSIAPMTDKIYQSLPHWHLWDGKCIKNIPFELRIACLGLFCQAWFYDIMLRKARDRNLPKSREAIERWRADIGELLDIIKLLVDTTRDPEAEKRHEKTSKPINKIKHWINTLLWRH